MWLPEGHDATVYTIHQFILISIEMVLAYQVCGCLGGTCLNCLHHASIHSNFTGINRTWVAVASQLSSCSINTSSTFMNISHIPLKEGPWCSVNKVTSEEFSLLTPASTNTVHLTMLLILEVTCPAFQTPFKI